MIVVLDYGMGNLRSVEKAIQHLGFPVSVQPNLVGATRLIIPGVGAFGAAMERLEPLKAEIQAFAESGQPLMGICLGQQLLFESSEEFGAHAGLELVGGRVLYFPPDMGLKVPHMGWNGLSYPRPSPLFDGLTAGDQVYFVHSLFCDCADEADVAATCDYGVTFAAAVQRGNVWGTQFHPEKSGELGLGILANFLNWSG